VKVTTRGPREVRDGIAKHLAVHLPVLVPLLREQWEDEAAFPPAGPDSDNPPVPDPADVWPFEGHPVDRWPSINVAIEEGVSDFASVETTEGLDSTLYFTTYTANAYVWINVPDLQAATDVRDDLQTAMRIVLLDMPIDAPERLTVLKQGFRSVYGTPQPGKGDRWQAAGRCAFSVRAQERITRPGLVTVPPSGPIDVDLEVSATAMPPIHPALQ